MPEPFRPFDYVLCAVAFFLVGIATVPLMTTWIRGPPFRVDGRLSKSEPEMPRKILRRVVRSIRTEGFRPWKVPSPISTTVEQNIFAAVACIERQVDDIERQVKATQDLNR